MKKLTAIVLSLSLLGMYAVLPVHAEQKSTETISYTYDAGRWETKQREMEKLGRGLVAINTGNGVFLSWRLLDSEDARFGSAAKNVSFNVYRGNEKIAEVQDTTNYTDTQTGQSYSVAPVVDGVEGEKCKAVSVQSGNYFDIPLAKPDSVTLEDGNTYSYTANDASCGDIDGDGEYEIVLKWDANGKDNSQSGYTGNVLLDAYKLDGTRLWRVDLGKNIRAGAHYTQFLVYDFDLDGKAELTCQTSLGSKDNGGKYVTAVSHVDAIKDTTDEENEATYRNEGGYILDSGSREEFLTIFDYEGNAVDTIYYPNQIIDASVWGDTYGNRCDRFTATVAYMDGVKPYAVYMRGYYMRQSGQSSEREAACAVSFDGTTLECTHSFDTYNPSSYRYKSSSWSYSGNTYKGVNGYKSGYEKFVGNGNHNCSTADVDGDGKDEVITGSLCYQFAEDNSEMVPKWCTFLEHGDALHIGDYDPTHEGFEFFTVHEDGGPNTKSGTEVPINFGMSVIDPGVEATDPTDEAYKNLVMFHQDNSGDTGRGMMANVGSGGYYQITGAGTYQNNGGKNFTTTSNGMSSNFRIFWDDDLYDELLDGTSISNYTGARRNPMSSVFTAEGCVQINGTKANPALQADLFGDWREEVVYPTSDNSALRVFTTTTPTDYKIKTLMQDPVYRAGVSAEQTAYNQPPHVGLYLDDERFDSPPVSIAVTTNPNKTVFDIGEDFDTTGIVVTATLEDGRQKEVSDFIVSGYNPNTLGEQDITVKYLSLSTTFKVKVRGVTSITVTPPDNTTYTQGQAIDPTGMVITATYDDGTEGVVTNNNYTFSGYNSSKTGEQTVTVTYGGKTDTFTVTVKESELSNMNGDYVTTSTTTQSVSKDIGSFSGDFTIHHALTINSMPANGSVDKNNTSGFFLRFMAPNQTGGGWYLTQSGSDISLIWKNTQTTPIASGLEVGKTYYLVYDFSEVGTGNGASATLSIYDSDKNLIAWESGLNLRNFSDTNTGKASAITTVQINNQANSNSTASVSISGASLGGLDDEPDNPPVVTDSRIVAVSGGNVFIYCDNTTSLRAFAAKYNGGVLEQVTELAPLAEGEDVYNPGFAPDKVFLWANSMQPIDVWTKAVALTSFDVNVTVYDSDGEPVSGAVVRLRERQSTGSDEEGDEIGEIELSSTNLSAVTDENGLAEFTDVPAGNYTVFATYSGSTSKTETVTLQSERSISCSVQFRKTFN